tara:strand:- start:660 stop:845 length:186 start_codon:yes stop_codon:yes gene_type:complete
MVMVAERGGVAARERMQPNRPVETDANGMLPIGERIAVKERRRLQEAGPHLIRLHVINPER